MKSFQESCSGASFERKNEINHGQRIGNKADDIWKWTLPTGPIRASRRAALLIQQGQINSGKTVLELGCGTGIITEQLAHSGAKIVAMTTGGKLQGLAIECGLDYAILPAGLQPRAALGLSVSFTLIMLNKLGFASDAIVEELYFSYDKLTGLCDKLSDCDDGNPAVILANEIHSMCPIIYGSEDLTWVVALRFRGQLEENAKMLAFHHSIPEQNHNEIEGWSCHPDLLATKCIIWLKDKDDHPRSLERMEVTAKLLDGHAGKQVEIAEKGRSALIRLLKMIHFTDWVSYYAALLNNVDPTPVERITKLKEDMAKQ